MQDITILITCIGGQLSPYILTSLKKSKFFNVRIIGTDMDKNTPGKRFVDSFYPVESGDSEGYCNSILNICMDENVQIVLPTSDEEALSIAKNKTLFDQNNILACVPPKEFADILSNKADMFDWLKERDLPLPDYLRVNSVDDLYKAAELFGYPENSFIIKPTVSRGGRGVWGISSRTLSVEDFTQGLAIDSLTLDSCINILSKDCFPEHIAMPYFIGDVYDVDVLANEETTFFLVPRRRFHVRTNPFRGCYIEKNKDVIALVEKLQKYLQLPYLFDYDIILDDKNIPWLLEVNPRMSGSVAVTISAGLNLIESLFYFVVGETPPNKEIPWGKGAKPVIDLAPLTIL